MKIYCKFDQMIDPKQLKNHPQNRNKHGQDQIERLAELYKYHGIRHPIIVSEQSGFIVAGHGRKLAAIRAGIKEMPVVFQSFSDSASEYAFLQADNAIASWAELDIDNIKIDIGNFPDLDLNMLGIRDFQVEELKEFLTDPDDVPEEVEPKTKLGDIYQLGEHRLMCGDSTSVDAVEKLMNGEKADMVFTDPPYGLGDKWSGGTWAAKLMYSDAKQWDRPLNQSDIDWFITLAPIVIIWGGNYYKMPASRCWLSWNKTQKMETMADFELAWSNLDKVAKSWSGARNTDGKRSHPTQKPVGLMEWSMSVHANPKSVLDLFGGSGSTLIACEKTSRKCFMMELDPHYCDVILARWEKFTGKKAELTNGKT